ncbi:MAG: polysaccharide biosynthesis protein [Lachnospiraceae bacterium]|nr:polysaccharide biosynthesis protein [Lachnospiraceae bacterium]
MNIDRKKNAIRNIVWGILNKVILVLFPFITRTILIQKLGTEYLGVSSLFSSVLQVLNLAELGFGNALVFSMYKPIAENDGQMICALLNTYRKVYHAIGVMILMLGLLILPFVKYIIKGDYPAELNIYIIYLIYLLNSAISYFAFVYRSSLLLAHNRNDIISKISSSIMIFQYLVQAAILYFVSDYYLYIAVLPIFTMALNIAQALCAVKMYPEYVCRGNISREMRADIKKRVYGLASYKIYGVVFSSVDSIVISMFLGLAPLGIYNNYYYIITSVEGFLVILINSLTAGIGNSLVLETKGKNYHDYNQLVFLNTWIVGWCAICMSVLFQPFIEIWIGKDYWMPYNTVCLLIIMFYASRATTISYLYKEALGLWWEDRIRPLISTIVNLTINILLVQKIGLNGVIISTVVCTVFINVPWGTHILFKNYFKEGEKTYYINIIKYAMITILIGIFTYYISSIFKNSGFEGITIRALICLIIPNLCFVLVYHRKNEFKETCVLIKSIMKRCL